MSSDKLMVVVGAVRHEPWQSMILLGQANTWMPEALDSGIPVRLSHGNGLSRVGRWLDDFHERWRWHARTQRLVPVVDNALGRPFRQKIQQVTTGVFPGTNVVAWQQRIPDYYALQRWKIIGSCVAALKEEFDYLYFTTASSYVRPKALIKVVQGLPTSGVYAGTSMIEGRTGEAFVSGASRILSRDFVEFLVRNRRSYANDVMEDVGMGRMAREFGIGLQSLNSLNIASEAELDALSDEEISRHFHFRLKSVRDGKRDDIHIMRRLHDRVHALEMTGDV